MPLAPYLATLKSMKQVPNASDAQSLYSMLRSEPGLHASAKPLLVNDPDFASAFRVFDPGATFEYHNTRMPMPRAVRTPPNLDTLLAAVREAASQFRSLKAMGDGWGLGNAVHTSDWLVHCLGLNRVLPLESELYRASAPPDAELVRTQAGITFEALNEHLAQSGRTVLNQPGFKSLTYVGCASAGGHGSGRLLGGIATQIEAIELVTVNDQNQARVVRVEPTNGLSDPSLWRAKYPPPVFDLLQDDATFHAVRCGAGMLGVVYAVTARVQEEFRLEESRSLMTWSTAWPTLQLLLNDPTVHSAHLWLNPYLAPGKTDHTCVLTQLKRTTAPLGGSRGFGIAIGGMNPLTDLVRLFVSVAPGAIPFLCDEALKSCVSSGVVLPSTEALDFGAPNSLPVSAASMGFDSALVPSVVAGLMLQLDAWRSTNNWVSSPVGIRWVRASDDWLSPQFGRETVMLEVPIMKGTPNATDTLTRYANFMMDSFGARPHWGQHNPMNRTRFEAVYGPTAVRQFAAAYRTLNPNGFFDSPLTQQLGIRDIANGL
jgi:L-gulono-1,4-lactone dehydrogenase